MGQHVNGCAGEILGTELHACVADREDLGVSGRVMALRNHIRAFGENLADLDDHRRERSAALLDVAPSQVDGPLCEVHLGSSIQEPSK
jgi:hypothetical protein